MKKMPGLKAALIWFALCIVFVVVYRMQSAPPMTEYRYSDFVSMVTTDTVTDVAIDHEMLVGRTKAGKLFKTVLPINDSTVNNILIAHKVNVLYKPLEQKGWLAFLSEWGFAIGIMAIFIVMIVMAQRRGMGNVSGNNFGFMNHKAKEVSPQLVKVTFADVAGVDEGKMELQETVNFLKDPKKHTRLGASIQKGVLIFGPPGVGKTLMAQAVAGEAQVPFFQVKGSEFIEMFVGVGAARVRSLFEEARRKSPCIIFIDEIDAIGRRRSNAQSVNHSESEQTLNQLLASMNGFNDTTGVIVIGATNRVEMLDEALLRPGRFDRRIEVTLPDVVGRKAILLVHAKKFALDSAVDLNIVARDTFHFSGADLANLLNEAAMIATRQNHGSILPSDIDAALDRIRDGAARPNMKINADEKRRVAYHETGHAMMAMASKVADPVRKITVIPHGKALGYTSQQSEEDRYIQSVAQLEALLAIYMGGRAAEKLIFKDMSTGAANDLAVATHIARNMVTQYGMSSAVGPVSLPAPNKQWSSESPQVSETTMQLIDQEIKKLIMEADQLALDFLQINNKCLDVMAARLLEVETLTGDEARALFEQYRARDYSIE